MKVKKVNLKIKIMNSNKLTNKQEKHQTDNICNPINLLIEFQTLINHQISHQQLTKLKNH